MTGVFRPDMPFDIDLLRDNLKALRDFFADPDQLVPARASLFRFGNTMRDIHSRNAFVDRLSAPFLPGMFFDGNDAGLDYLRRGGNLRFFKDAVLIRLGLFLAAATEPLIQ